MSFIMLFDGNAQKFDYFTMVESKPLLLAILERSPIKSGCYVYLDAERKVLYVGKTAQLDTRLEFHGTKKGIEKKFEWHFLGVIFADNPLLLERELILKYQPQFNKLGK